MADGQAPPQQPPQLPDNLAPLPPGFTPKLRARLIEARDKYNRWRDGFLFNGSTILVLILTAAAAYVSSLDNPQGWIAPLFSGLAGVFVAMERALGFGARWRFNRDLYYAYESIIDMIDFFRSFHQLSNRSMFAIFLQHFMRFGRVSLLFQMQGQMPPQHKSRTRVAFGFKLKPNLFLAILPDRRKQR